MADSVKVAKKRRSLGNVFKKNKNKEEDSVLAAKSQRESSDESEKENSDCEQVVGPTSNVDNSEIVEESQSDTLEKKKKKSGFRPRLSFSKKKKKAPKELNPEVKRALESIIKENFFVEVEDETNDENSETTQPKPDEENSSEVTEENPEADNDEQGETIAVSREDESEEETFTPKETTEHLSPTENNTAGKELAVLTADQMYSTLMRLLSDLLLKAGQSPRQVIMYVLSYLVKKYPHCFNIKAMRATKSDRVAEQDAAK